MSIPHSPPTHTSYLLLQWTISQVMNIHQYIVIRYYQKLSKS